MSLDIKQTQSYWWIMLLVLNSINNKVIPRNSFIITG